MGLLLERSDGRGCGGAQIHGSDELWVCAGLEEWKERGGGIMGGFMDSMYAVHICFGSLLDGRTDVLKNSE